MLDSHSAFGQGVLHCAAYTKVPNLLECLCHVGAYCHLVPAVTRKRCHVFILNPVGY